MSFLFVAGSLFLFNTIELSVAGQGSTPKIKEIVLGRCYEYQLNTIGPKADNWKDCNKIWKAFHKAFAHKNPCEPKSSDYEPFFGATEMQELSKVRKTDNSLRKHPFLLALSSLRTFREEERLRLSDRNSILMT